MKAYIVYDGGDENSRNQSLSQPCGDSSLHHSPFVDEVDFPDNASWEDIRKAPLESFEFGMSHVVAYFVTLSVIDGRVAGDKIVHI